MGQFLGSLKGARKDALTDSDRSTAAMRGSWKGSKLDAP